VAFLGNEFADDGTTVSTARRVGSFSRTRGQAKGIGSLGRCRRAGGGTRWLTGAGLSDVGPQGGIRIRPDEQWSLPMVIRTGPAWGLSVAHAPYGTVHTTRSPTLRATNYDSRGCCSPSCLG